MNQRYWGYGGLFLLLLAVVLLLVSVTESRYETGVAHFKGTAIAKDIRPVFHGGRCGMGCVAHDILVRRWLIAR